MELLRQDGRHAYPSRAGTGVSRAVRTRVRASLWPMASFALLTLHAQACCGKRETDFKPHAKLAGAFSMPSAIASVCGIPLSEAKSLQRCQRSWANEEYSSTHALDTPTPATAWSTVTIRPGVACGGRFTMVATTHKNVGPFSGTLTTYDTSVDDIKRVEAFVPPATPPEVTPLIPGEVALKTFRQDECPGGNHRFAVSLPARRISVFIGAKTPLAVELSEVVGRSTSIPVTMKQAGEFTFEAPEERTYVLRVECRAPITTPDLSYYIHVCWGFCGLVGSGCFPAP